MPTKTGHPGTYACAAEGATARTCPEPGTRRRTAHRRATRCAWVLLLARIYEALPLRCPTCGGEMRIVAFITNRSTVCDILTDIGEPTAPPDRARRGPPLWAAAGAEHDPSPDAALPPTPAYEFDQRIAW